MNIYRTNITDRHQLFFFFALTVFSLVSCSPKNYPTGKAFVYDTKVSLNANMPSQYRKDVEVNLYNYLDDSLKVVVKSVVGTKRILNPPVFDSVNITRSREFMKDYLNSLGYYQAELDTFTVKFDTVSRKQIRTYIKLVMDANQQEKIDSISYDIATPQLQQLALESQDKSLLKKGNGYSKELVAQELDRLVLLYRSHGYYRISRSSLLAEVDTINKALINLNNDPLFLLQQIQSRRTSPTIDVRIFQRPNTDTSFYERYKVGRIVIFPETNIDDDKNALMGDTSIFRPLRRNGVNGIFIRQKQRMFSVRTVRRFNSIETGNFYDEQDYYKTFNAFSQVGSWQQVDVKPVVYKDSTDSAWKVDFNFFLTPAKKYSFKVDFEGSQNIGSGNIYALTGSLFGLSIVSNLLNRNFARSAIQWNNNIRAGVEINSGSTINRSDLFQTLQFSGGTSFSVPRLWPPMRQLIKKPDAGRTFLNVNGGYTNRRSFYDLTNINLTYGYEWKKKNSIFTLNLANFELVDLKPTDTFLTLILNNPVLIYSFNQGVVVSTSFSFQHNFFYPNHPNQSSYFKSTIEESGLLAGNIFFKKNLYRFWKWDAEFRHSILRLKHKWAFRLIGGYGRDYTSGTNTMPFFRQFLAGGPNSMRAWRLRQLGLGNSLAQDTLNSNFKDRLGDIYLEANAEYRFAMFKAFTFPIEGAFFTDIGNIWNRTSRVAGQPDDGVFQVKHLYRDLAVALGYGIRWDFGYLRIRLDAAYKVKDPAREGAGWVQKFEWKSYDRAGIAKGVRNSNVGFQFGIDYPF